MNSIIIYIILYYIILYYIISYHISYIILYHIMLYHIISHTHKEKKNYPCMDKTKKSESDFVQDLCKFYSVKSTNISKTISCCFVLLPPPPPPPLILSIVVECNCVMAHQYTVL